MLTELGSFLSEEKSQRPPYIGKSLTGLQQRLFSPFLQTWEARDLIRPAFLWVSFPNSGGWLVVRPKAGLETCWDGAEQQLQRDSGMGEHFPACAESQPWRSSICILQVPFLETLIAGSWESKCCWLPGLVSSNLDGDSCTECLHISSVSFLTELWAVRVLLLCVWFCCSQSPCCFPEGTSSP